VQEQDKINKYLQSFGLVRQQTGGDGNCLFRAISRQLYNREDQHAMLRKMAVRTIQSSYMFYANFFDDNDFTLASLGKNGVYAGQESLLALSEALEINVLVTMVNADNAVTIENNHPKNKKQCRSIHICYSKWGGGHYESVAEGTLSGDIIHSKPAGGRSGRSWDFSKATVIDLTQDAGGNDEELSTQGDDSYVPPFGQPLGQNLTKPTVKRIRKKEMCNVCRVQFRSAYELKRHNTSFHGPSPKPAPKFKQCTASGCGLNFISEKNLLAHMASEHAVNVQEEKHTFNTTQQFLEFITGEEDKYHVNFVRRRGVGTLKNSDKHYTLYCHRSGKCRTDVTKVKKKKGSCRVGVICPSRMSITNQSDGKVLVKYIAKHNHKTTFDQAKYMRIPEHIKEEIRWKLGMKIKPDKILDDVRNIFNDRETRNDIPQSALKVYHLLEKKTILAMRRKMVMAEESRHADDATSVKFKVEAMKKEIYNPILAYKPFGVDDTQNYPTLKKEDFFLAIMTRNQEDMYHKMAPTILCLDSTHNTNEYKYKLITALVPDECRKGYPVAFCISSHERKSAIVLFLQKMQERSPNTNVTIIMSDDDCAAASAAKEVYGQDVTLFLCTWHVLKAWQRKMPRVVADNKEIRTKLSRMIYAKSKQAFRAHKSGFIRKFSRTYPVFVKYFQDNYENRAERWAHCFRQDLEYGHVDTNMFLESFHNRLKSVSFEQKQNRRIDALLDALMAIEKHIFISHFKMLQWGPVNDRVASGPHVQASHMDNRNVMKISEVMFKVQSASVEDTVYTVERVSDMCSVGNACIIKCMEFPCVDLCSHLYTCTCPHFQKGKGSIICKHIHKVHGHYVPDDRPRHNAFEDLTCMPDTVDDVVPVAPDSGSSVGNASSSSQQGKTKSLTGHKNTFQALVQDILERSNMSDCGIENYEYLINQMRLVQNYLSALNHTPQLRSNLPAMSRTLRVAPNQNNVRQMRFPKPKKGYGRPKKK